jgi:hypothetical protein
MRNNTSILSAAVQQIGLGGQPRSSVDGSDAPSGVIDHPRAIMALDRLVQFRMGPHYLRQLQHKLLQLGVLV